MRGCLFLVIVSAVSVIQSGHAGPARILGLFPHTGRSHQMVFEPMLQELALRGHNVTVVSFFPLNNPPPNYRDISLRGLAPIGIETIDMSWFESETSGVMGHFEKIMSFLPLADMATSVCQKIVDWPELREVFHKNAEYDVVLVENFNSDCMLGLAHAYGIQAPVISLMSSTMLPWSYSRFGVSDNPSYVPSMATEYTDLMTFAERLQNTVLQYFLKLWFRYAIQVKEQQIIEKHMNRKITDLDLLSKNMTLMLVNTHHSLNGGRPTAPGIIEVGGMHITPSKNTIPANIEKFINESKHGVVLFSFGSLIKTSTMSQYKHDLIVKVLQKLPQRFIWKYESSDDNGTLVGNILKLKWLPQRELLQHPKVIAFIAHGGLLGMSEAVHAGVPMVVIPLFGDQFVNAAAAADAGLAKVLKFSEINEQNLFDALQQVLSKQTRVNAVRLSTIWRDRPLSPLEEAVYWVERTARLGHTPNTAISSRYMPAYQVALLDVAVTLFLIVIVVLLLAILLIRLLVKFILKITNIKSKNIKEKDY